LFGFLRKIFGGKLKEDLMPKKDNVICKGKFENGENCGKCSRCVRHDERLKSFTKAVQDKMSKGQDLDFDGIVRKGGMGYLVKGDHPVVIMSDSFYKQFLKAKDKH